MILFHRHFGEGSPVMILHGLFGQCDNWVTVAKMLGEKHHSVFCVDLRNHGHSPHDSVFNYDAMAEDLAETILDLRIHKKVHLIGHSMGGKAAMFFAQQFPELLKSILIADIGPRFYPTHHQEVISGLKAVNLSDITSRSDAESAMEKFIKDQSVRQFLLKNLYRTDENQFAWRFNLEVISDQIEEVGKAIPEGIVDIPALFYHGSASNYVLSDEYPVIMQQFISAEFRQMNGAGHWLHAEQPTVFVETADHWLRRYE